MSIYRNVIHDAPTFEAERQIFLLAKAGADVWNRYMELEPALKPEGDPLLPQMRELYHQLVKTDIFMGGVKAGKQALEAERERCR